MFEDFCLRLKNMHAENSHQCHRVIGRLNGCINKVDKTEKKMSSGSSIGADEVLRSQTLYIDNLQQQVYFLENENTYLRTHVEQICKTHHSNFSNGGDMVKKQVESQKETQKLKLELKRKQTTIDFLMSEAERVLKKKEENEAAFFKQKSSYLEEVVELRKEKDEYLERNFELERLFQENEQKLSHVEGDYDSLKVQYEEIGKEIEENRNVIEGLQSSKQEIQKLLIETNLRHDMKAITERQEAIKHLKVNIEELHGQLAAISRTVEHEKLLRQQLAEDNEKLIKRHASMEAELAEIRAKYREELDFRNSLEEIHLKTVVEIADSKSSEEVCQEELNLCKQLLKSEKERNLLLATQVSDEQRLKMREEQNSSHIERRLEQKEEKIKLRENENTHLLRDNAALKDEVKNLKEQMKNRDMEVEELKLKVQKMHISVEEYTQFTKTASHLEEKRWKQLNQLAHGIQTISKEAVHEKN